MGVMTSMPRSSHPITSAYIEALEKVFCGALPPERVHIHMGGIASWGASRTLGKHVYLQRKWAEPWQAETPEALGLFIHEAVHVWQYLTLGWPYASRSLWEQFRASVIHGNRRHAYRYNLGPHQDFLSHGIEEQAQMIQDWYLRTVHGEWESTQRHCANAQELSEEAFELILAPHLEVLRETL